jgi:VIT1/CCC1 family predicted Fe2+/Mn2+ transporter
MEPAQPAVRWQHLRRHLSVRRFAYGSAAAILTSVGLVVGFNEASSTKRDLIGALLIVAIADNLTDSLSIHIYQESEHLQPRSSFTTALTNFAARFALSMSFVALVALLPLGAATVGCVIWGLTLLVTLTWVLARDRGFNVGIEITKHLVLAVVVVIASTIIGAALSN